VAKQKIELDEDLLQIAIKERIDTGASFEALRLKYFSDVLSSAETLRMRMADQVDTTRQNSGGMHFPSPAVKGTKPDIRWLNLQNHVLRAYGVTDNFPTEVAGWFQKQVGHYVNDFTIAGRPFFSTSVKELWQAYYVEYRPVSRTHRGSLISAKRRLTALLLDQEPNLPNKFKDDDNG